MSKTITKEIKHVWIACPHIDHTGTFTKGGAKPCCSHTRILKTKGYDCFKRTIRMKKGVVKIQAWCPLDSIPKPRIVVDSLTFGTQNITLKSKEID